MSTTTISEASRKWWALAAVGSGTFMSTVDGSIVNIALNTIQKTFSASLGQVEWVVLAYLLSIVCLLPTMGRLGDMIGRRRVYLLGFVLFTAGSALSSFAWNIPSLIVFRMIQAVGAAMIQSMGMALLVQAFPASERGRALGYNGTIIATGVATGPVLGGLLIGTFGWRSIFYVNVPLGLLALTISWLALADDTKRNEQKFDVVGAMTLGASLIAILVALTEGQHLGFDVPWVIGLFVAGIIGLIGFVRWERQHPAPMIDMGSFSVPAFSLGLMTTMIAFTGLQFNFILLPFFLQNVLHYTPQQTGLMMIISPLAIMVMSSVSGRLSDRFGPRWVTPVGILSLGFGLFGMSSLTADSTQLDIILRVVFIGIGFGFFQSPNNSSIMGSLPRERSGVTSGMLNVTRTIGQISGITLAGAIWSSQVTTITGQVFKDITMAPTAALVEGYHVALLVAAGIALSALIPALWPRARSA
ncbi:MAG: MFS transporter [Roseiflexaceae bacterium]